MSGDGFSVLDHVSTGVLVLDRAFNVVFWNRQLEAWTGIARAQIQGRSVEGHFPDLIRAEWREAFDAGSAPRVILGATHEATLGIVDLQDLKRYALDLA